MYSFSAILNSEKVVEEEIVFMMNFFGIVDYEIHLDFDKDYIVSFNMDSNLKVQQVKLFLKCLETHTQEAL